MSGRGRGARQSAREKQSTVLSYVRSLEHSPSKRQRSSPGTERAPSDMDAIRELLDEQFEKFSQLKEEFQEIANAIKSDLVSLRQRVTDLEEHVNQKDKETEALQEKVDKYEKQVASLEERLDANEANSRLPTLVLSGPMVARSAPGRRSPQDPARRPGTPPPAGSDAAPPAAGGDASSPAGGPGRPPSSRQLAPSSGVRDEEDVPATVVLLLNEAYPDLHLQKGDIARAHRDRTGKKIWCKFVHSGPGSKREIAYSRRLSLKTLDRDNALYINESLSKVRNEIFNELLSLKKQRKIYTVFTRNGAVFFKDKQYGQNVRVDNFSKLTALFSG